MLTKRLAAIFLPLFIGAAGPAFAQSSSAVDTTEKTAKLGETLTTLHAVGQWSVELSQMAQERAKSQLVKNYAREMATANEAKDAKLMAIAQKHGIEVAPLDPQIEESKSMLERMKAEKVMLGSLEGDAFDKSYMTLVTNTQQSLIHFLDSHKAAATDPAMKQVMGDMATTVRNRLKTAQTIMAKIYGDTI